ncbi:flagellar filament capping protein FliD [Desulfolucanica intricata]|uniref:flagellar filament capping protein FliD n=1 Tax=Desulfolucanica intricata TaxID=1285191 RepID=UPI000833525D|nr:flagellar filament capping protein FliD [Desulfolucanica intricata]
MASSLRIGGLASGMDIDSMVKELMKAERMRLDSLTRKRQILQWQREDYRTINNILRSFRDTVFNMKLQGTFLTRRADSNNESVVKVTAGGSAVDGIYEVKVTQMARGAYLTGGQIGSEENPIDPTRSIASQLELSGEKKLVISGPDGTKKTFTINTDTASINDLVNRINTGLDDNGKTWGVRASYDAVNRRFFLMTKDTGVNQTIEIEDGELAEALKLTGDGVVYSPGQDAKYKLNGVDLTAPSNKVLINGLTLELKGESDIPITVTVSRDTDSIFNVIKGFVEKYNETIDAINKEYYEERYKDYQPLTDAMREELSDKQEEQWEEKARSGMLRFDSMLGSTLNKFRNTMISSIDGIISTEGYNNLSKIGINTASYQERGKLVIDETKLKEAIQKDPDGVMSFFTKSGDTYNEKGLAGRLYDDVTGAINSFITKAGSSDSLVDDSQVGKQIRNIDKSIDTMNEHLQKMEDRYWRQFTAMEKAINQLNQQSAWLAMMFGGM